jgi:hypothetical protein
VSQVTHSREIEACIFWTTIPVTIADTQQPEFFILSRSGERPERNVESFRFDTMPSSPNLQAWRNTISPSSCFCINATVGSTGVADI